MLPCCTQWLWEYNTCCSLLSLLIHLQPQPSTYHLSYQTFHTTFISQHLSHKTSHTTHLTQHLSHNTGHIIPLSQDLSDTTYHTQHLLHNTYHTTHIIQHLLHNTYITTPITLYKKLTLHDIMSRKDTVCVCLSVWPSHYSVMSSGCATVQVATLPPCTQNTAWLPAIILQTERIPPSSSSISCCSGPSFLVINSTQSSCRIICKCLMTR